MCEIDANIDDDLSREFDETNIVTDIEHANFGAIMDSQFYLHVKDVAEEYIKIKKRIEVAHMAKFVHFVKQNLTTAAKPVVQTNIKFAVEKKILDLD